MESKPTMASDIQKQFEQAGFEVIGSDKNQAIVEVKKDNCTCALERNTTGEWEPFGPPYFLVRGMKCELEDQGYQKFWYSNGKRFPIRKTDLQTLHRFDEEVRAILGLRSLYNESLGTTCARTVYDRLNGRPDK